MRILIGDVLAGIEHQHDDVGFLDRLQGLDHRKFLDGFEHLAATTQARRVDQRVFTSITFERHFDGVARRTRHVERDDAVFTKQCVNERGFADIRPPDDGDLGAARIVVFLFLRIGKSIEHQIEECRNTVAVRRRYDIWFAAGELVELGAEHGAIGALTLCMMGTRKYADGRNDASRSAICLSCGVKPARPSTMNSKASASAMADSA